MLDPRSRPTLDFLAAVSALSRHRVRWVMAGSIVLLAYGVRLEPGDLDVVPALDEPNLKAVSSLLASLDAVPRHFPDWPECPPLEWHSTWRPEPATEANLDYLFVTAAGPVDIVPTLCGTYEELVTGARAVSVAGRRVLLAHPEAVLQRLDGRRRKDVVREREVSALREVVAKGQLPEPDLARLMGSRLG